MTLYTIYERHQVLDEVEHQYQAPILLFSMITGKSDEATFRAFHQSLAGFYRTLSQWLHIDLLRCSNPVMAELTGPGWTGTTSHWYDSASTLRDSRIVRETCNFLYSSKKNLTFNFGNFDLVEWPLLHMAVQVSLGFISISKQKTLLVGCVHLTSGT